ncbi:MAG: CHASE domain-containing protein [Phycisphaerales bacterium]
MSGIGTMEPRAADRSGGAGHVGKGGNVGGRIWLPLAVALLGLVSSGLTAYAFLQMERQADRAHFATLCERLRGEIVRRVIVYRYGMMGTRSVFAASTSVERAEFGQLVGARELDSEFPGSLGIGYIHRVRRAELPAYLERVRGDGAPDFAIRNDNGGDELYVIQYIEPLENNTQALGLDIAFEANRRAAADAAMRAGDAALTGEITLVQADGEGAGFLYLLPYYRRGEPIETEAQRVEALEGWIYMPLVASRMFAGAHEITDGELDFEVFDGTDPDLAHLLYDDDGHLHGGVERPDEPVTREAYEGRELQRFARIDVGGRTWTVAMSTTPRFARASRLTAWLTGLGGGVLSILLGAFLHMQGVALDRARRLAESMTRDMRRLALVAERTTNVVIITDARRRIEWVNEAFTRLSGYTLDEVRGKVPGSMLQFEGTDSGTVEAIRAALAAGEGFRGEIKNRGKHGREYWLDVDIQPLREGDGAITGYMAVESDITPLIAREAALRESEERWEFALVGSGDGVWDWDVPTGSVRLSERWKTMLGYEADQIDERVETWSDLVHPDDLPATMEAVQAHFEQRTPAYRAEFRMRRQNSSWMWILARGHGGAPGRMGIRMVGTHTDIAGRSGSRPPRSNRPERSSDRTRGVRAGSSDERLDAFRCGRVE